MRGVPSFAETYPPGCILTKEEKHVLFQWVRNKNAARLTSLFSGVRENADLIIATRGGTPGSAVGRYWVRNFVSRHPEIFIKQSRSYDIKRAKSEYSKVILGWFDLFESTKINYGICDEHIYNFDETGFAMGATYQHKVVTGSEVRGSVKLWGSGNREWVTAFECVSFSKIALSPTIIFEGKKPLKKWPEVAPFGLKIALSEN